MKEAHKELCDKLFTADLPEIIDEVAGIIKTVLDNYSLYKNEIREILELVFRRGARDQRYRNRGREGGLGHNLL